MRIGKVRHSQLDYRQQKLPYWLHCTKESNQMEDYSNNCRSIFKQNVNNGLQADPNFILHLKNWA